MIFIIYILALICLNAFLFWIEKIYEKWEQEKLHKPVEKEGEEPDE